MPPSPVNILAGHRVFVGPNEIAGVTSRIAAALAQAGAEVRCFFGHEHPFNPGIADLPRIRRCCRRGIRLASKWAERRGLLAVLAGLLSGGCKAVAFLQTCLWADTVIMVGGKGFFATAAEHALLRRLGKRVIHVFVGTASRPRYLSGYAREVIRGGRVNGRSLKKLADRTRRQARRIRAISRQASLVVENPLCGHFQERPFVNWFKLGVPLDVEGLLAKPRVTNRTPPRTPGKVRVLHCPSRPEIKGSARIQDAMEKLAGEGLPIDFRQVSGVPHGQVLHEIAESDFVVDQLYSDSPLAGFAAEASAFGKPAVVGGYGWELLADSLRQEEMPPTVACHPDRLSESVRRLVEDVEARQAAGAAGRDFLQSQWSEAAFAERFARLVQGDIPEDWLVAPETVRYAHGLGLEGGEVRRLVGALVERHGASALGVDHLPGLRDHLIAFGGGESQPT